MIHYKNNRFYINNQEVFVMGAELHYFRVKQEDWEDRIIKIKNAGCNLISTYIPWLFHEAKEGDIDLTGRTLPEKDLLTFVKLVAKHQLYVMIRPGPYVMAEVKNAGLPDWLLEKYPEIRARDYKNEYHCVYELVSLLHPTYLQKVDVWYRKVFTLLKDYQIDQGGPIIMAQLDNEVGMFPWVTAQMDLSDTTLVHFNDYLKNHEVRDSQIFLSLTTKQQRHYLMAPKNVEQSRFLTIYKYFERQYIRQYLEQLQSMANKYGMHVPIVVNVHGFTQHDYSKRGNLYPIGLSQLLETTNIENMILAGDYYIGNIVYENVQDIYLANAITKAIQPKEQPLFSAEFQSGFQNAIPRLQPNTHDLKSRICIGQGMKAINYYMFVGGYNFEDIGIISKNHDWQAPISMTGELRPSYHLLRNLKSVIDAYGTTLVDASLSVDATLGLDIDYFLTNYKNPLQEQYVDEIEMYRNIALFDGLGKALCYNNIQIEAINLMKDTQIDVLKHPKMIAFSPKYMNQDTQQKLADYVQDGGQLILYPCLPTHTLDGELCTILQDATGVKVKEERGFSQVTIAGVEDIPAHKVQIFDVEDTGIGHIKYQEEAIIGFEKILGKGKVIVVGALFDCGYDYQQVAMLKIYNRIKIHASIVIDEPLLMQRQQSNQTELVFIHNLDDYQKQTTITFDNQRQFGGHKVVVPGRNGLILPINYYVQTDLVIDYATQEILKIETDTQSVVITFWMKTPQLHLKYTGKYQVDNYQQKEIDITYYNAYLSLTFIKK